MKIVIPIADLHRGGGCKTLVDTAHALQDHGHQVEIVLPEIARIDYPLCCNVIRVPYLHSASIPYGDVVLANFYSTFSPAYRAWPKETVRLSLGFEPMWVQDPQSALATYATNVPVISISHWLDERIFAHAGRHTKVVNLGIDTTVFHPNPKNHRKIAKKPKVILYIARDPYAGYEFKGYPDFLSAMQLFRELYPEEFIVDMVCTERHLDLPGIPHRIFTPKNEQEMADLYRNADVFVSTSWFEGFALPPLEAMACGTPVVATNSGGILDYCTHMQNAYIANPRDPVSLVNGLLSVLGSDALSSHFVKEGIAVSKLMTKEQYATDIVSAIETIVEQRRSDITVSSPTPSAKVSIVIPFYNCAFIDQSIQSALNQTYPDIEVIVVNDGATIHAEKIHPYADRIIYIEKGNGGTASALNAGFRRAAGQYVTWLSSDDLYDPNKVLKQVAFMKDREAYASYTPFWSINPQGERIGDVLGVGFPTKAQLLQALLKGCPIHGCSVMLRREVLAEIGDFDESLHFTQDYEMWLRVIQHYELFYLHDPLVFYRVHPNMGSSQFRQQIPYEVRKVQARHQKALLQLLQAERKLDESPAPVV